MDWKGIVGTVAPTIATALGGPLAGMAIKAIGSALGLGDGASEKDVSTAMASATPEQLLALKKADQDFAVRMRELDIDLDRIAAADRDSARRREAEVKDVTPRVLAFLIVGAFIGAVASILFGLGKVESALAGTLVGYLSAKAEQVVSYYFGSSSGSARKDVLIAQAPPIK